MAGRILTIIGAAALNSLALPAVADEASNPRARNSFTLAGEDLTFWPLTIAERYYIWRGNETLAGRGIISVSARCRLWSTDGLAFEVPGLLPVACAIFDANGTELAEDNPLRRLATRYIQRSLPYLPNDLFEGVDWADYSSVQFGMNLSTGELEPWSISRAGRWSRRTTSRSTPDRSSSNIRRERYAGARGGSSGSGAKSDWTCH